MSATPVPPTSPDQTAATPRWLPSPVLIFVVVLAGILFAAVLSKGAWDTDYYWHVTTGQLIAQGHFPTTDPYSFTWGGKPWTLHEWLSELLIYWLVSGIGYMGAVMVFAVLPGVVFGIMALALARRGLRTTAIAVGTSLSAAVLIPYMTLRPQVISWIFFATLMVGLLALRPHRRRWVLVAFPFFLLWANVHGLWAVGLGLIGFYALLTMAGLTPMSAGARLWPWLGLAAGVIGTAFTPAGPIGILYPLRYVEGGDWGLANITEWQSPNFHEPAHWPLLLFIVGIAVVGRRSVPLWLTLFAWLGIAMALLALRNAPIAGIIGLPALALGLHDVLHRWRPARTYKPRIATTRRVMESFIGVAILVGGCLVLIPRDPEAVVQANVEKNLPVEGAALLKQLIPDARVAAEYGWGGYVIHELYPTGGTVMVDGRNDMYDQSILETYGKIREADPGWTEIADQYRIDALLFPPDKTITKGPAVEAGWCEAYRDDNEVLFLRTCPAS